MDSVDAPILRGIIGGTPRRFSARSLGRRAHTCSVRVCVVKGRGFCFLGLPWCGCAVRPHLRSREAVRRGGACLAEWSPVVVPRRTLDRFACAV